jgi:hypothetical protein
MSNTSHYGPVAAEPSGDVTRVGGMILEPSSWLLQLGAAARTFEVRVELQQGRGRPIRAWCSRRAGARTRRGLVRQALSAVAAEPPRRSDVKPVILPPETAKPEQHLAEEPATALVARIGAYTAAAGASTLSSR